MLNHAGDDGRSMVDARWRWKDARGNGTKEGVRGIAAVGFGRSFGTRVNWKRRSQLRRLCMR